MSSHIDWSDVIKKEARGLNDADFGEVQEVTTNFVISQKGLIDIETFGIPKEKAESYDGSVLRFGVSEDEALSKYRGDGEEDYIEMISQKEDDSTIDRVKTPLQSTQDDETIDSTTVPLMEEKIEVSKHIEEVTATIVKNPMTETKIIEVPVTHEEISIERRKTSGEQAFTDQKPVTRTEEIEIPVKREEIDVNKRPYIKEEVIVKKKPVTETREITQ
ncbi:YsnF/AvaK domain-containing protein [Candidatus Nitrosocosmicus franklandus]|uniref:Stress response protein YsnF n=1 Tax=Candidatus Nitrosocosmicus franklandianus TaxID=1798806 RepID=A0A484IG42_9ARCH|nr:YsnF/AvaK domain-containing protein [Candidatus Nitrosocosmicus franklandus]VFJ13936.1 Stress response protein YsnF [Candidatus Nitrosocosmicus franklandus]